MVEWSDATRHNRIGSDMVSSRRLLQQSMPWSNGAMQHVTIALAKIKSRMRMSPECSKLKIAATVTLNTA